MIIGLLRVHIHLSGIGSLKQKRSIVKSLVERLKNRFNVSAAEVDMLDSKSSGVIGVVHVSNDSVFASQYLETVVHFIQNDGRFYIIKIDRETFAYNE
jgi:uncharacterized protein YlxP (DUF503 family)